MLSSFVKCCCLTVFLLQLGRIRGFSPNGGAPNTRRLSTELQAWFPNEGVDAARSSFPLWLFGAAGSGGLARNAIPRLIDEWKLLQTLKGVGPKSDGPTIGLSSLTGFPEDIAVKDIEKVVNNRLSIDQIVSKYPVEDNFLASKGYLTITAFEAANAKENPLAVRAVFDSFGKSKAVEPQVAAEKLETYKKDPSLVASNLLNSRLIVITAVSTLLFLLGLADLATATDGYYGWFPDWPGGKNFPWSMFTEPGGSPFSIPEYWIDDM